MNPGENSYSIAISRNGVTNGDHPESVSLPIFESPRRTLIRRGFLCASDTGVWSAGSEMAPAENGHHFSAGAAVPRMIVRCVNRKIAIIGMLTMKIEANTAAASGPPC